MDEKEYFNNIAKKQAKPDDLLYIKNDNTFSLRKAFTSNKKIKNVKFDKKCKITEIPDYSFADSSVENIDLSQDITYIRANAFNNCQKLQVINLPKKLTTLGYRAFKSCPCLKNILLPENISFIDAECFYDSGLTEITLPKKLTELKESVFRDCKELKNITLPPNLKAIKNNCFDSCTSLKTIILPNSLKTIGDYAFNGCENLKEIKLPKNLEKLGEFAFSLCSNLEEIEIPKKITEIDDRAFNGCKNLSKVLLNNAIQEIKSNAFSFCRNLPEIILPESLESLGGGVFNNCTNLHKVNIPSKIKILHSDTFEKCTSLENILLPENLTNIEARVFRGCTALKEIIIPENIKEISNQLFEGCNSLTFVKLPKNLDTIRANSFSGTSSLEEINIPDSVDYIGYEAFCGSGLKKIILPTNLNTIESNVFKDCKNLEDVIFNKDITSILSKSFYNCTSLKQLTLPQNINYIGKGVFMECSQLDNITIPSKVKEISEETFYNCKNLKIINLPETLTVIDDRSFYGTKSLTNITIPNSVKYIGEDAFNGSGLTEITLPKNLDTICSSSFQSCAFLEKVVLPENLKIIENNAFYDCFKIKEVILPDTVESLGDNCFNFCKSLKNVRLPKSLETIPKNCFSNCKNLQTINLPNNLKTIKASAFYGCQSLKELTIPYGVTTIEQRAFQSTGLEKLTLPPTIEVAGMEAFDLNNFNYIYKDKTNNNIIFSSTLPKDTSLISEIIDLTKESNLTVDKLDYADIVLPFQFEKEIALMKKIDKMHILLPNHFIIDLKKEKYLEKFIDSSKFKYFFTETKDYKITSLSSSKMIFKFANLLGCFSPVRLKNKAGVETSTPLAQKASSFFITLLKNDNYVKQISYHMGDLNNFPVSITPSQDLFNFISTKGPDNSYPNLDFLFALDNTYPDSFANFVKNFNDIKEKRIDITRNDGNHLLSWEQAYQKFLLSESYPGIGDSPEEQELAKLYLKKGLSSEIFNHAKKLYTEAKKYTVKSHILGHELKEEQNASDNKTIIDEIYSLQNESTSILKDNLSLMKAQKENLFTYEWLDKYDPKNAIMGLYCSCCCSITTLCYGATIAEESILNDNIQNLVIKDNNGVIIAKGTMYIDPKRGFGVFNDFEINEKFKKYAIYSQEAGYYNESKSELTSLSRKLIFEKLIKGMNAFINDYNLQYPKKPLKQVNVGMGYNRLKALCLEYEKEKGYEHNSSTLRVPGFFEDARYEQIILYKNESLTNKNSNENEKGQ